MSERGTDHNLVYWLSAAAAGVVLFQFFVGVQNVGDLFDPRDEPTSSPVGESAPATREVKRSPQPTPASPPMLEPVPNVRPDDRSPRSLADALVLHILDIPERTSEPFPLDYFRQRIAPSLNTRPTNLTAVRVEVTFVEPRALRAGAVHGSIIGFLMLSLRDRANCMKQFGDVQRYQLPTPQLGIMKAIDEHAGEIVEWIELTAESGELRCPNT